MSDGVFISRSFLLGFVEVLAGEIGGENLSVVLEKAGLPVEWASPMYLSSLHRSQIPEVYAGLQAAVRRYYGRGARGTLLRVGGKFWRRLLVDASPLLKVRAAFIHRFPAGMRRKAGLDLLARLLSRKSGDVTVHTLDMDFLLVDHFSPTTLGQKESMPLCYVTQGLIREALSWALDGEYDVEETSCRVAGGRNCEFKIQVGGQNENI